MWMLNSSTFFLWPIWLFVVADVVFSCGRCGCGRYGTEYRPVIVVDDHRDDRCNHCNDDLAVYSVRSIVAATVQIFISLVMEELFKTRLVLAAAQADCSSRSSPRRSQIRVAQRPSVRPSGCLFCANC